MNMSGIRPTEGFYTYNINKINEQKAQMVQKAGNPSAAPEMAAGQKNTLESAGPEQKFTSFDYAKGYEPEAVYELKGKNSDIRSLDMEKAISDMQKDQLLQQYQFFVGDKQAISNPEALVKSRPEENFNL